MKQVFIGPIQGQQTARKLKKVTQGANIVLGVLLVLILTIPFLLSKWGKTPSDLSPVVLLDVGDGSGSAIYIGNNQLLTAAHVVRGMDVNDYCVITFVDPNSTSGDEVRAQAQLLAYGDLRKGDTQDYALLQIRALDASRFAQPYMVGNSKPVKVGDPIKVEGFPGGHYMKTDGTVSSIMAEENPEFFVVSAGAWPGNSGGALLDKNNKVIGVVTLKGVGETNVGQTFVLKIDNIRKELLSKGFTI